MMVVVVDCKAALVVVRCCWCVGLVGYDGEEKKRSEEAAASPFIPRL